MYLTEKGDRLFQIKLHEVRAIALPRLAKTRSPIVDELRSDRQSDDDWLDGGGGT